MDMSAEDFFKKLMRQASNNNDVRQVDVGRVSDDIVEMKRKYERMAKELEQDLELKSHQMKIEIERKLEEEFGQRREEVARLHNELWTKIYNRLDLDPKNRYNLNTLEGRVYQLIDDESIAN
jgi:hypothetical protein